MNKKYQNHFNVTRFAIQLPRCFGFFICLHNKTSDVLCTPGIRNENEVFALESVVKLSNITIASF